MAECTKTWEDTRNGLKISNDCILDDFSKMKCSIERLERESLDSAVAEMRAEVRQLGADMSRIRTTVQCPIKQGCPMDGVISYLTRKHGGNVHDQGIVAITASSCTSFVEPKVLADFDENFAYFESKAGLQQWVRWEFKGMRVEATHYTIRSSHWEEKSIHPQSWIIEGSMDGKKWMELDRRTKSNHLNGSSLVASFTMAKVVEARFIRLSQIGKNHSESDVLAFAAFEIFGLLSEQ
jgi:hypothetical protein